jgi:hypothetical protein
MIVIYSFIVLATVIMIVNCNHVVIMIVNYDHKTFIVQATRQSGPKHLTPHRYGLSMHHGINYQGEQSIV